MSIFTTEPVRRNGDRDVSLTWELGPTTSFTGEAVTAAAELYVYHDRDRKRFVAGIKRIDVSPFGRQFTIGKNTEARLATTPCARYSAKGLDAAVDAALAELRSRIDEPDVQAVADPTSPA